MKFSNDPIHPFLLHDQRIEKFLQEDNPLNDLPTIPEFFANREVFVTGGTGFIGKLLIEKLLRSCPEIKTIYLLLRAKKGQSVEQRLKATFDLEVFEVLRRKFPNFMDKLVPISGDVTELNFGISDDDRKLLDRVSVVFHSAANVRFDNPLKIAILMNTRGTRELMKFCETLTDLKVVLHISTAYSNCHADTIEEKIYPPLADWRRIIEICEKFHDSEVIDFVTSHLTEFEGNTYTFSKHLAEQVLNDYKDKLPIAVVRPTVVIGPIDEPIPGYVDNFNGPVGINIGSGTGLLKATYADPNNILDFVPVDIVVKAIIMAAWKRTHENSSSLPIYNTAMASKAKMTGQQMKDVFLTCAIEEFPFGKYMMLPPSMSISLCRTWILVQTFFLQLLPSMIFDTIMMIRGKKMRLMKIQRKAFESLKLSSYFVTKNWTFKVENFDSLSRALRHEDVKDFDVRKYETFSPILASRIFAYGIRKYILQLKDEDLEKDRLRYKRIQAASLVLKTFVAVIIFYIFLMKIWKTFCCAVEI